MRKKSASKVQIFLSLSKPTLWRWQLASGPPKAQHEVLGKSGGIGRPLTTGSSAFATRLPNARVTCRDGIPCRFSLYILSFYNQKSGGGALNAPLSNRSKSFDEQDSSPAFVRLSIVRLDSRPPALQKHASLTKKRSVTLHSQKMLCSA